MPSATRIKRATWRSPGTLCRDLDWPLRRLLFELRQGTVRYRTCPAVLIDWRAPNIERNNFEDLARGEVTVYDKDPKSGAWLGRGVIVVVEVLPPQAAEVPSLPPAAADAPAAPPAPPRMVSDADLRRCILAIAAEHPPGSPPLDEETFQERVETRLDAQIPRDRFRQALENHVPHLKLPRGRPRKSAQ